ncbi:MAG: hypothetical protein QOJ03_3194, partial [Frankiaceae bacterium]|nr:hypothetical protein [Frankiaceae bacterium]
MVGSMARRARRWIAGGAGVGVLVSTAVVFGPLTSPASAVVSTIPSNYFTIVDPVADDQPNQKDLSQMGRDDTSATRLKIFWSWDDTSFTAQTGDACALFSATPDGHTTFAICGEVENGSGSTVVLAATYPRGFTCDPTGPHPLDRCESSTTASIGSTTSGPIGGSGTDLVTATDPHHAAGNDTTLAIDIDKTALPVGADLVNVCSYPSAANGANNDPSDCIVTPGAGFLSIVKNTTGGDGTFDFTVNPGSIARSVTTAGGTGTSTPVVAAHGTDFSVAETVPSDWLLSGASCALQGGGSTGTFSAAQEKVSSVELEVGRLTTCTFSDTAASPELTLDKQADVSTYAAVGDTISYTYDVTNSGNVPLTPPYAVSDDKVTVTCPQLPDPLALNGSIQCTASHDVTQADLDAGSITNTATASANYNGDTVESNEDSVTVTAVQGPELTLDKASPDLDYDHVGQVVSYTYDLTNSGNVTLSAPYSIDDDLIASVSCPPDPATLAPGDGVQCTATYTVTQADLDAGSITNNATGHAQFGNDVVDSNEDSVTIGAAQNASLHLAKDVTESSYDHAGQVLHYTYTLTNNGNVTLNSPYDIDDDLIADAHIDCTTNAPSTLAPTEHYDCTGTYTVTQLDIDAGS